MPKEIGPMQCKLSAVSRISLRDTLRLQHHHEQKQQARSPLIEGISALLLWLLLLPAMQSGKAQATGICSRTSAVREAIVAAVPGKSTCSAITTTDLSGISGTLRVSDNAGLTTLQAGDFTGMTSLKWLTLERNSLSSLPSGIFSDLTSLTRLDLDNNKLTALPANVFDNLTSLQKLFLNSNHLGSLPTDVFDNLTGLTRLTLYNNRLTTLPAGIFEKLTSLPELSLSKNRLATLPSSVFRETLENLRLNQK